MNDNTEKSTEKLSKDLLRQDQTENRGKKRYEEKLGKSSVTNTGNEICVKIDNTVCSYVFLTNDYHLIVLVAKIDQKMYMDSPPYDVGMLLVTSSFAPISM